MGREENINPRDIRTRGEYDSYNGNGYDQRAIKRYRENGYTDRVIVERGNDGHLYAMEGSHRVRSDRQAGRKTKAVVYQEGTTPTGGCALVLAAVVGGLGAAVAITYAVWEALPV